MRPPKTPRRLDAAAQARAASCFQLAYWMASRCANRRHVPLEDAIDEAVAGLFDAAAKYDATRGASFSTFAWRCIKNRLYHLVARYTRCTSQLWRLKFPLHFSALRDEDESFDVAAPPEEDDDLLSRLRDSLPPSVFRLLYERFVEGRELADIGRDAGITKQAVSYRLEKALALARSALSAASATA